MKTKFKLFKIPGLILLVMAVFFTSCNDESESIIGTLDDEIVNIKDKDEDGNSINIINQNPSVIGEGVTDALVNTFKATYHKMVAKYNPDESPKEVRLIISPTYTGAAYTANGDITVSAKYLLSNPNDVDFLTHELMHVVQSYPKYDPVWLVEGIADYARNEFGVNNAAAGWSLIPYAEGQDYKDGYVVAASFLSAIEVEDVDALIKKLDQALRKGTYSLGFWVENTGFSLNDLWLKYAGKYVVGGDTDWTNSATVSTNYENRDGANAGEGSLKVIDGDTNSKFLIFDYPDAVDFYIQQDLPSAEIVNRYTLTSGNDAPDRDPKDWTFSGSNDGSNWTVLDTKKEQFFTGRNETVAYDIDSDTPYKHYRITINANNGGGLFQLSEWRLLNHVPKITDITDVLAAIVVSHDNPGGPGDNEGSLKVVDGDTNSKFLIFDYPDATNFYMQQDFNQEQLANAYTLTSGNDAPDRDPKDWILSGSNDGTNWTELDTQKDQAFAGRNETVRYSFKSNTAYKHYRLSITANNDGGIFQLSEWRLLNVE